MTLSRTAMPWRGWSGRQYPVAITDLDASVLDGLTQPAVLLAVQRDSRGFAAVRDGIAAQNASRSWPDRARTTGATELHIYILNPGDDPTLILDDLLLDPKPRAAKRRAA